MSQKTQDNYSTFLTKLSTVSSELISDFKQGFEKAARDLNSNSFDFFSKTKEFKNENIKETSFNGTLIDIDKKLSFSVSENKNSVDVCLFLTLLEPIMFNQFYKIEITEFNISYSDLAQNEQNCIINYINDPDDYENTVDFEKVIIKEINNNYDKFTKQLYETQSKYHKKLRNFGYLSFSKQLKSLFNNL